MPGRLPNLIHAISVLGVLSSGCTAHNNLAWLDDPELVADPAKPCPNSINMQQFNLDEPGEQPNYLPGWAAIYPDAVVRTKTLQCEDGKPVWYSVGFRSDAHFDKVKLFYDTHFDDARAANVGGKWYSVKEHCIGDTFDDFVNVVRKRVINGEEYSDIVIGVRISADCPIPPY